MVSLEQCFFVVFDDVDFAANLERLSRLEAAQPKVTVQTANDALKQFLIRLEGCGENHPVVRAVTTDQPVAGYVGMQRPRVHVRTRHARSGPNLPGNVPRLGGPALSGHHRAFAVEVDETLFDVGVLVRGDVRTGAGEFSHADAGLCPMRLGALVGRIVRGELEINLVMLSGDDVFHRYPVAHLAVQFDLRPVGASGDQTRFVADHCVFTPVGRLRVIPAVGFKVMNFHLLAGQMIAADGQVILGPVQLELGRFGGLAKRDAGDE